MSGYIDTAFSYDESDLGLDPETKLRFKPNKKELELFKLEKLNMYKGTWMVCFVYGITAIILLSVIFFTEWGRTYIYDKFFPAVITYVLGAIVIIIYLIVSIFSIVPRKLRKSVETLPVCPDYWKLQRTDENMKTNMKANITNYHRTKPIKDGVEDPYYKKGKNDQYILDKPGEDINISSNDHVLDYKCVPDNNVYGDINNLKSQLELINENNNRYHKGTTFEDYKAGEEEPKYIYVDSSNIHSPELASSLSLQNYAQITGVYKNSWTTPGAGPEAYYDNTIVKYDDAGGTKISYQGNVVDPKIHVGINTKPLICNELYPYLLDSMENKEKNQELKCEYAKKCGVSWSYLDCYGDKGVLSSIPLSVKAATTTTPPT